MSDGQYRKLGYSGTCCFPRRDPDEKGVSIQECVKQLEKMAKRLRVRGKSLLFQINNNELDAKEAVLANDKPYAAMLLRKNKVIEGTRKNCIRMQGKVELIRHEIETAAGLQAMKRTMKGSKQIMDKLLLDLDVASLDELMDDLSDNIGKLDVVGDALGRELDDIDVTEELMALQDGMITDIVFPEVPAKVLNNNNNAEQPIKMETV